MKKILIFCPIGSFNMTEQVDVKGKYPTENKITYINYVSVLGISINNLDCQ